MKGKTVRFHFAEAMTNPDYFIPLAKAAEANGYSGTLIPDSICYPQHSDTKYSYNSDGSRDFLENKPFIESFVLAAAMGAVTEKLELEGLEKFDASWAELCETVAQALESAR